MCLQHPNVHALILKVLFLCWGDSFHREGDGTPRQYSCLENPMDGGTWEASVHGVAKSRTQLSNFTFTFHFHALEKEMATHSSVLAWRIPGTGKPCGLPSMGSHRVGHDWSDLAVADSIQTHVHFGNHKKLMKVKVSITQLCLTLRDFMDCSLPDSSMRFSRQESLSGLPCPPPGHLPDPGIELACFMCPALTGGFFTTSAIWEAQEAHASPLFLSFYLDICI